jgi:hypothetical protein
MVEVADLPSCCVARLREMERILDSFGALETVLSIAPSLTAARPRGITSVMAALWNLAKAGASYISNRRRLRGALEQTARSRVRTVITLHVEHHIIQGDQELEQHWTRMLEAF